MTNRADWFFAYTAGGAAEVIRNRFPPDRVTVVQNSTKDPNQEAGILPSEAELSAFRKEHAIVGHHVAVFIGGLDDSKRIDFLLEACSRIAESDGEFQLVVAGDGPDRGAILRGDYPWLRYIGRVGATEKLLLSRIGRLLLMPGRVGLVAVDSFYLGLPLVTTDWALHAPEFEYLVHGVNAWVTPNSVVDYADSVSQLLGDDDQLSTLMDGCHVAAKQYTLEAMVERFCEGVQFALERGRR